jgi:hypothetical protein
LDNRSFDALTRRAVAPASRRITLLRLGAVGAAAFAAPVAAAAKRGKRKKKKPSVGEKAQQKCLQQADQCVAFLAPTCGEDLDCRARAQRCCALVGECDVVGLFTCAASA